MTYGASTLVLIVTVALFLWWGRGGLYPFGWWQWVLRAVVALPLLVSGAGHFLRTALYASIIPPAFPHRELLVLLSGALEVAGAVGLLLPRFSRAVATSLALLMIAIFPANVYAAHQTIGGLRMPGVPLRAAMQVVYILLLLIAGWGIRRSGLRKP